MLVMRARREARVKSMVGGWLLGLRVEMFCVVRWLVECVCMGLGVSSCGVVDVGFDRVGCDPGFKVHLFCFFILSSVMLSFAVDERALL